MPIFPLLLTILPSLIKGAEVILPRIAGGAPTGAAKKNYVLMGVGLAYDHLGVGKMLPDFPNVDERRLVMRTAEVWIEELLPVVLGGRPREDDELRELPVG